MLYVYFILSTIFIFFSTSIGSIIVLFFKYKKTLNINIFLSFAGGIMLSASIFSLLLPALDDNSYDSLTTLLFVIFGILIGAFFILIFDVILKHSKQNNTHLRYKKMYLAMTIHNIPEGLAVGLSFGVALLSGVEGAMLSSILLAFGIGIQNIPEGASTSLSIYGITKSKTKALYLGILSGSVEIFGSIIGFVFAIYLSNLLPLILSIGAGSMLYVVIDEIIINKDENSIKNNVSFLLGFLVMMILDIVLG